MRTEKSELYHKNVDIVERGHISLEYQNQHTEMAQLSQKHNGIVVVVEEPLTMASYQKLNQIEGTMSFEKYMEDLANECTVENFVVNEGTILSIPKVGEVSTYYAGRNDLNGPAATMDMIEIGAEENILAKKAGQHVPFPLENVHTNIVASYQALSNAIKQVKATIQYSKGLSKAQVSETIKLYNEMKELLMDIKKSSLKLDDIFISSN